MHGYRTGGSGQRQHSFLRINAPLYLRFGLTQSSDSSSVLGLSLTPQSVPLLLSSERQGVLRDVGAVGSAAEEAEEEEESYEHGAAPEFASNSSFDFVQALLRHETAKRRRVYLDRTTTSASTSMEPNWDRNCRRLWIRCDDGHPVLVDHIALMNGDVVGSGHRTLTILGCDATVHTHPFRLLLQHTKTKRIELV